MDTPPKSPSQFGRAATRAEDNEIQARERAAAEGYTTPVLTRLAARALLDAFGGTAWWDIAESFNISEDEARTTEAVITVLQRRLESEPDRSTPRQAETADVPTAPSRREGGGITDGPLGIAQMVLRWAPPPHADSEDRIDYAKRCAAEIMALRPTSDAPAVPICNHAAGIHIRPVVLRVSMNSHGVRSTLMRCYACGKRWREE